MFTKTDPLLQHFKYGFCFFCLLLIRFMYQNMDKRSTAHSYHGSCLVVQRFALKFYSCLSVNYSVFMHDKDNCANDQLVVSGSLLISYITNQKQQNKTN